MAKRPGHCCSVPLDQQKGLFLAFTLGARRGPESAVLCLQSSRRDKISTAFVFSVRSFDPECCPHYPTVPCPALPCHPHAPCAPCCRGLPLNPAAWQWQHGRMHLRAAAMLVRLPTSCSCALLKHLLKQIKTNYALLCALPFGCSRMAVVVCMVSTTLCLACISLNLA